MHIIFATAANYRWINDNLHNFASVVIFEWIFIHMLLCKSRVRTKHEARSAQHSASLLFQTDQKKFIRKIGRAETICRMCIFALLLGSSRAPRRVNANICRLAYFGSCRSLNSTQRTACVPIAACGPTETATLRHDTMTISCNTRRIQFNQNQRISKKINRWDFSVQQSCDFCFRLD